MVAMSLHEDVAERLADSLKAHKAAVPPPGKKRDWTASLPLLKKAYQLRQEAHDLDPEHTAPAWAVSLPHEAMMSFYVEHGATE